MGPNELVSNLLIFDVYFKMTKLDTLFLLIIQYAIAMQKAIDKVRRYITFRQVHNILNTQNRLSIRLIHDLPINLSILIY